MKNVARIFSVLIVSGVIFVACGGNNNAGTCPNGNCALTGAVAATSCPNPGYPYLVPSVPNFGGAPGCCNSPTFNSYSWCQELTNGSAGCAQFGAGYYWNGYQCVP